VASLTAAVPGVVPPQPGSSGPCRAPPTAVGAACSAPAPPDGRRPSSDGLRRCESEGAGVDVTGARWSAAVPSRSARPTSSGRSSRRSSRTWVCRPGHRPRAPARGHALQAVRRCPTATVRTTWRPGPPGSATPEGSRDRWKRPSHNGSPAGGARERLFSPALPTPNRSQPPARTDRSASGAVFGVPWGKKMGVRKYFPPCGAAASTTARLRLPASTPSSESSRKAGGAAAPARHFTQPAARTGAISSQFTG
jgi:hypothetical protein